MLSFNNLGRIGRLGNQMFQYSALKGIAEKNNFDFCMPESNFSSPWVDHQLFDTASRPAICYYYSDVRNVW